MKSLWAAVMALWALGGSIGLGVSLFLLSAVGRTTNLNDHHIRQLAIARLLTFGFVVVNAPIVYLMFAVESNTKIGDRVMTGIPFWAILLAAVIVIIANTAAVVLTLSVIRGIRRK